MALPTCQIIQGDCRDVLKTLPDESVHCVVTSPPYWGLRDYGVEGQLGLEKTPEEYVSKMVAVFREVRRVLRSDGTAWVNMGDSYASQGGPIKEGGGINDILGGKPEWQDYNRSRSAPSGLKPKDLCGIPWRLAFALQTDGWVLRQEIIWSKPNPMPESVRDRCTKAHEQIFMFAKARWVGPEPVQFSHISDQDARWLALLIDAEGCIVLKRCQHEGRNDTFAPQVSIGNTSRALMEEVVRIVGHGTLLERPGKNCRMIYWQLANNVARDFLHRIYPFLIVKQRQARIGIHVDSLTYYRGGKRPERKQRTEAEGKVLLSLWARCKECNHFGSPDLSDVPEPTFGRWADCERYFFDAEAIKEPTVYGGYKDARAFNGKNGEQTNEPKWDGCGDPTRNRRSVWTINSEPYPESHFATFPTALVKPCILAGTSARGCCPKCGAPWERVLEKVKGVPESFNGSDFRKGKKALSASALADIGQGERTCETETTGWLPTCSTCGVCDGDYYDPGKPIPCTVLDPFGGSGTTGQVALELGRHAILIELNPDYVKLAEQRVNVTPGLLMA